MRPSKGRLRNHLPAIPKTWGETLDCCPFRSFVGKGISAGEMMTRLAHTFAAIGGEPCPIDPALLDEMAASIHAGKTVLVLADRADLRDRAKREILARVHGAAETA